MHFFCDGENDCGDWSDEFNCTRPLSSLTQQSTCPANSFKCAGSGMCIPQNWVCDGSADCLDGLDELNCNSSGECKNGFKCGKECILNQWVCDGEQDCVDGLDESDCGPDTHLNHTCLPEHGWFSCPSKGNKKCMPIRRACDGYNDCDDRSDEGGLCNKTKCDNTTCANGCNMTPKGPICVCPIGFRLDASTCVDIDECSFEPPLCSQNCLNTRGAFQCSCVTGYSLGVDNRTCVANGIEAVAFITTAREIRSLSLKSKEYTLVQTSVSQVHSVDVDYDDRFVFWTEKSSENAGIFKCQTDGSAHDYVVSVGIEVAEDLSVDWVARHIYFADSGRKHIVACDMQGTLCTVVVSGRLDKPRAVVVYPETRLVFWTDWSDARPHIGSAGMDGSDRKDIVTTEIAWPNGLAVDDTIHRIFWCDAKLNRIESARLDGSDRRVLQVTVNHPYSIAVFENLIYWTDPVDHEVRSCNKFTGKNPQILMKEASLTPTGIHIHHPSKQRQMLNPCWHVICSHLCLLSPSEVGYRCACPVGMSLNSDNRTCDQVSSQSSIVIATYSQLFQVTHHQIGRDSIVHLPTRDLDNIGALCYNALGHSLIYADISRRRIYSMHLETFRETILFEDADSVEGIDVDPYTENVYWTEISRGRLVVGNVDRNERLVLARSLNYPGTIVLAPERGIMFIVEGRISHEISVWNMDGSSRTELLQVYGTVSSLAYDGHFLYISDSGRGTIERVAVDGQDRSILRSHLGSPVAMFVGMESIFWLTRYSNRVNFMNKKELKTRGFAVDAGFSGEPHYRKLVVIEQYPFTAEHRCLGQTGTCSDFCVPVPEGAKCLCPIGKELDSNKHVCHTVDCKGANWFQCSSGCVPSSYRCDGVEDCSGGQDEKNCTTRPAETTCSASQFQCNSGSCIERDYVCDGEFDCRDESDEPATCPPAACNPDEFACANNRSCIPHGAYCDGQRDCADGSDEANCKAGHTCTVSQFYCPRSKLCVPMLWVCDKDADCEFGEDETDCSTLGTIRCPVNYIRCPGHQECIPRITLCNGIDECQHGTDQQLCSKLNSSHVTVAPEATCRPDQFTCYLGSSECVSHSVKCNCEFDCLFGEDEEGCSSCPGQGFFRCPGELRYINSTWLCDGLPDCSTGADELPAICPKATNFATLDESCLDNEFQCKSGQCIQFKDLCDGIPDCEDGTDEGGNCTKSCIGHDCAQDCVRSPGKAICLCRPGFKSLDDGRQCHDVDECTPNELCSQLCINSKGSYHCTCLAGYSLESDHRTCKATEGRPFLVTASQNHIDLISSDDPLDARQLVQSDAAIKDIAYHVNQSVLYWVTSQGLYSMNTMSSESAMLFNFSNSFVPSGLALDRASGNLYVSGVVVVVAAADAPTNRDQSTIKVINPRLSAMKNLVESDSLYTDVALDSQLGLMFWSEHRKTQPGRIMRSAMDGLSKEWLVKIDKIVYPVSLVADVIKKRIYWADLRLYSISVCDYFGNDQRQVVSNTHGSPLSVAFFENHVSWTNLEQNQVHTQAVDDQISSAVSYQRVSRVLIAHAVVEAPLSSPCSSLFTSPCGNGLCLLKNATAFSCACPQYWAVDSVSPFRCRVSPVVSTTEVPPLNPGAEVASSPGVTVASILICLAILTILAILGCVYYRRWRRTIGSPLKVRIRTALGLTEQSGAWEESVDYSDRKMLYCKSEDDHDDPDVIVDQNENRTTSANVRQTDSAYASQQSLAAKAGQNTSEQVPQLLPVSYSMRDQLLASEL